MRKLAQASLRRAACFKSVATSQQALQTKHPGPRLLFGENHFHGRAGVRVTDLLQLGALFVGGIGIGVALINQRRQLNAQMFIEFSKRFDELLRLFPTEAWLANRRPNQELPPPSKEITECTLYCIQFVADVYHLHKAGYI